MSENTIPDGELLEDLGRVNDEVGGAATVAQYDERGEYHYNTLVHRFGSWAEAQAEFGHNSNNKRGTEDEILSDVERVNQKLDRPATTREYDVHGDWCYQTVKRRFGSWAEAQAELGNDVSGRNGAWR